ncbi:D-galacturonic acid binding lectin [Plakobranchus ocellatus]|uniref:D-galacturonic acid binding lectin n=1 Tax=Plakobranchus ocellatus TaxID=259542 RepID=A0AAV3YZY8_9GAST|nr:D-galacturonic acid binding lectin [Plakobranchus ocellatus]
MIFSPKCLAIVLICCVGLGSCWHPRCQQLSLHSIRSRYRELTVSRSAKVISMSLVRSYTRQPCTRYFTYGFYGPYAWVNRGCRGLFRICSIPGATRLITCSSRNNRVATCNVRERILSATVKYHLSRNPCVLNYSYRVVGTKLQVYNNCRATFTVGC